MSSTTENLGLTLPDVTDFYDVGVTNTNMSLIDAAVGQIADTGAKETSVQSIITKVGTTTDTGGTATTGTVMGKLNAIQNNMYSIAKEYASVSTSGIPLISTPLTLTITGSGRLYGLCAETLPNYTTDSLNKLIVNVTADSETVLTNTTYRTGISSTSCTSHVIFGTSEVVQFVFSSPDYYYHLLLTSYLIHRNLGSANVFGEPTTSALVPSATGNRYGRISVITNPIKFNQSVNVTISAEDVDNINTCKITCIYILD